MRRPTSIRKGPIDPRNPPKLTDLSAARAAFSWDAARGRRLDGLPGGGLNIAWEATERHACGERPGHVAIRWLGRDGTRRDISYAALTLDANRFANVLRGLGIGKGDCVFLLCAASSASPGFHPRIDDRLMRLRNRSARSVPPEKSIWRWKPVDCA